MTKVSNQDVQEVMFKKSGKAISFLASELLRVNLGNRIPTFSEMHELSGFSRGTLQNAMQSLENMNAVSLVRHGHKGSYLIEKNTETLLKCLGTSYVCGIMPIPYTKRYEGLVTGLLNTFSRPDSKLAADIVYMRGSQRRIKAVEAGRYDFGITSRLSAQTAINKGAWIEISRDFGKGSYVSAQSLFFRQSNVSEIQDGMRVGIDPSSLDHVELTKKLVAGHEVKLVNLNYNQIMKMIDQDMIDVAVWNVDNIVESQSDANYRIFDYNEFSDETSAVMVVSRGNSVLQSILDEYVDPDLVILQQQEVLVGKRYPNF